MVKRLLIMWETWVRFLGGKDPLEKVMATHSSTLAWKIPWAEKSGVAESDTTETTSLSLYLSYSHKRATVAPHIASAFKQWGGRRIWY